MKKLKNQMFYSGKIKISDVVMDANDEIVLEIERHTGNWINFLERNYDSELVEKAFQEMIKDRYHIKNR